MSWRAPSRWGGPCSLQPAGGREEGPLKGGDGASWGWLRASERGGERKQPIRSRPGPLVASLGSGGTPYVERGGDGRMYGTVVKPAWAVEAVGRERESGSGRSGDVCGPEGQGAVRARRCAIPRCGCAQASTVVRKRRRCRGQPAFLQIRSNLLEAPKSVCCPAEGRVASALPTYRCRRRRCEARAVAQSSIRRTARVPPALVLFPGPLNPDLPAASDEAPHSPPVPPWSLVVAVEGCAPSRTRGSTPIPSWSSASAYGK